ncbi:MAG: sulfatase [Bacteroidales bacterium]|nr:sulfatase [Bacteroidales bacterium]
MKHILINSATLLGVGSMALLAACQTQEKEQQRPNIIFIMSDDHAYQAISAYGHGLNQTPNIDRLANEGAMFTRSTVTNSISAPSRAVLLTGKHSFVNGKVDNLQPFDWDQPNFPKLMQANGYQTAMIGKIHLDGIPQGFNYSMVLPGQGDYYNPDFYIDGERVRKEGYCTEIVTEETIDWIKNKRDPNKPFAVLYHQKAPHRNWLPAPKYLDLYDDVTFELPETFFDDYEGRGRAAKEQEMQIHGHAMWGHDFKLIVAPNGDSTGFHNQLNRMTPQQREDWMAAYSSENEEFIANYNDMTNEEIALWKYNRYIKDYLRTIKSVDDGVGELLDYLEESGLAENTIVVYTSDQGFYLGEHGWFDKRFMYEESFRTPILMKYPKEIKAGTVIDKLVQNLDFAPTFLDYAGIEAPEEMQGESFRKLVSGKTKEWRDFAYYTYYEYPAEHMVKRHYGVTTDRYKLIHFYYDIDEWELYDLETDPKELNNQYNNPEYAEVREMMHKKLKETRTHYGDSDELNQMYLQRYLDQISAK